MTPRPRRPRRRATHAPSSRRSQEVLLPSQLLRTVIAEGQHDLALHATGVRGQPRRSRCARNNASFLTIVRDHQHGGAGLSSQMYSRNSCISGPRAARPARRTARPASSTSGWVGSIRTGDGDTLPHPARERAGPGAGPFRESHDPEAGSRRAPLAPPCYSPRSRGRTPRSWRRSSRASGRVALQDQPAVRAGSADRQAIEQRLALGGLQSDRR